MGFGWNLDTSGSNCGCEGPSAHLGPHPSIPETPVPGVPESKYAGHLSRF